MPQVEVDASEPADWDVTVWTPIRVSVLREEQLEGVRWEDAGAGVGVARIGGREVTVVRAGAVPGVVLVILPAVE